MEFLGPEKGLEFGNLNRLCLILLLAHTLLFSMIDISEDYSLVDHVITGHSGLLIKSALGMADCTPGLFCIIAC